LGARLPQARLRTPMIRAWSTTGVAAAALALLTGCGTSSTNQAVVNLSRTLGPAAPAITYDHGQVPPGAQVSVVEKQQAGDHTEIRLQVRGLQPNRMYGAHVHVNACGLSGQDAGPHYQNIKDPVSPSTDPKYANPKNEVWLDLMTDAQGAALAQSTLDWRFRPNGARSVVIHAEHTHTEPGKAGSAGARLACVSVPFK
jgi:superoxide dismutase, Cu-Zn family